MEHIEEKYHAKLVNISTPKGVWSHCVNVIGKNQMNGDVLNLYYELMNDDFKEGERLVDLCVRVKENHRRIRELGYTDEALIALMVISK